jgi:hypothetical protein
LAWADTGPSLLQFSVLYNTINVVVFLIELLVSTIVLVRDYVNAAA